MSQERELTVKKLYLEQKNSCLEDGKEVVLSGWIRSNRDNGSVGFIAFNDGSNFKDIQLVYSKETKNYDSIRTFRFGSTIKIFGTVKLTPTNKQPFEIQLTDALLLNDYAEDCPLQKKRQSFEFITFIR